jgi:exodeoxyribonuclease VII small subunit
MAQKANSDIAQLPFERAIEELESIVKRLEEGKVPLEESVAIYERGEALKRRCEDLLRQPAWKKSRSMRKASRPAPSRSTSNNCRAGAALVCRNPHLSRKAG